eukprot:CAMPEP_0113885952 /NCGR_PEP_ID=MMETSP0780_2-20120614/11242_1 /TAXON_ID=652834 /ORGANISM="Palpitomonas bilix" /LENGTH=109 /DNA_ID=CAMNT_0000874027 /DNA_START=119 /DNA_END=445 /DNA_ORIENTATION=+ /assembly_acc=CAM_ASM_000599
MDTDELFKALEDEKHIDREKRGTLVEAVARQQGPPNSGGEVRVSITDPRGSIDEKTHLSSERSLRSSLRVPNSGRRLKRSVSFVDETESGTPLAQVRYIEPRKRSNWKW